MTTKNEYFSVEVKDILALMRLGRTLMDIGKMKAHDIMKKKNISFQMMLIFDETVRSNGNDEDELLVMNIMQFTNHKKLPKLDFESINEQVDGFKKLLKPISDGNIMNRELNVQSATCVYFLIK